MAKSKQSPDVEPIAVPEGFEEITGSGVDGYFLKTAGNTAQGLLQGVRRYTDKKDHERIELHVELATGPVMAAVRDSDGDWVESELDAGAVLGVDVVANLAALVPYAEAEKAYDIFIGCQGKVPIGNGRSAWQFVKGVKPHKARPKAAPPTATDLDESVPF